MGFDNCWGGSLICGKVEKILEFWILDLKVCLKKLGLGAIILKILSCIYWTVCALYGAWYMTNIKCISTYHNQILPLPLLSDKIKYTCFWVISKEFLTDNQKNHHEYLQWRDTYFSDVTIYLAEYFTPLKVSRSQKQILKFSLWTKNERKYFSIFALASTMGQIKK